MKFGSDFFKVLELVVAILRMFARIFGDADDRQADDEQRAQHGDYAEKLVK